MPTGGSGRGSKGPAPPGRDTGEAGGRGPVRDPGEVEAGSGCRRGSACPTTNWQRGNQGLEVPSKTPLPPTRPHEDHSWL